MILDVFLVADEWPMMELRLATLKHVTDAQIAVRSTLTHQGQPANLEPIPARLLRMFPSLREYRVTPERDLRTHTGHVIVRPPDERGPVHTVFFQKIEKAHRDACKDAARMVTSDPDAVVLVSDVDEIPKPEIVAELGSDLGAAMFDACPWWTLAMRMHSTSLRLLHPHQPWLGTCASRLRDCAPQAQRDARTTVDLEDAECGVVLDAGIHASWLGTDEQRRKKLDTFSHAELRDADPAEWRARGVHANGEVLTPCEYLDPEMWWPEPLRDGTFVPPSAWLSSPS